MRNSLQSHYDKVYAWRPMNTNDSQQSKLRTDPNQATHIAIAIILVVGAVTTTAFLATFGLVPYEALIFVSGTVGGVVNSFRRIQNLSTAKTHESSPNPNLCVPICRRDLCLCVVYNFHGGLDTGIALSGVRRAGEIRELQRFCCFEHTGYECRCCQGHRLGLHRRLFRRISPKFHKQDHQGWRARKTIGILNQRWNRDQRLLISDSLGESRASNHFAYGV
jgi:hypothetical protein